MINDEIFKLFKPVLIYQKPVLSVVSISNVSISRGSLISEKEPYIILSCRQTTYLPTRLSIYLT